MVISFIQIPDHGRIPSPFNLVQRTTPPKINNLLEMKLQSFFVFFGSFLNKGIKNGLCFNFSVLGNNFYVLFIFQLVNLLETFQYFIYFYV